MTGKRRRSRLPKWLPRVTVLMFSAALMVACGSGPPLSQVDQQLISAAMNGNLAQATAALNNGANIEARYQGWTPLFMPAMRGDAIGVIKLLLDRGANPNARDSSGQTPLFQAARAGNVTVIKYLLFRGADPTIGRSTDGLTPIQGAYKEITNQSTLNETVMVLSRGRAGAAADLAAKQVMLVSQTRSPAYQSRPENFVPSNVVASTARTDIPREVPNGMIKGQTEHEEIDRLLTAAREQNNPGILKKFLMSNTGVLGHEQIKKAYFDLSDHVRSHSFGPLSTLKVYEKPDIQGRVIRDASVGKTYILIRREGDFDYVEYEVNEYGYIYHGFLD